MKKCRMIGFPDHPAFHDSGKNMSASLTRIMRKVSRTFRLEFNRHTESMQCVLYDDQLVDKAFSPLFKVCEVLFVRMGEAFIVRVAKKLCLCVLRVLFEHCGKFIGDCRLHFPLADEACQWKLSAPII